MDFNYKELEGIDDATQLRSLLIEIEAKAKLLAGDNPLMFYEGKKRKAMQEQFEEMHRLIVSRHQILNKMFRATPEEMKRLEFVNGLLYRKTRLMYDRTADLYRTILAHGRKAELDDDYEVEGTMRCCIEDDNDVLVLPDDNYYGSDFAYMMQLAYYHDLHEHGEYVENCHTHFEKEHTPDMTNEQLGLEDILDDGVSWAEGIFSLKDFSNICICHAAKQLVIDFSFSVPDLLRVNNVWIDAKITCQHIRKMCDATSA